MSYEPTAEEKRENATQLVKYCLNPLGVFNLTKRADYVKLVECMDYIIQSLYWNGKKGDYDFKGEWSYSVSMHDRKDRAAHEKAIDGAVDPLLRWGTEDLIFCETFTTFLGIMRKLSDDYYKIRDHELDVKKDNNKPYDKEMWGWSE